ncbi:MAG: GNAT family N-acetyltransferase [Mucilaginibacter polytrichastri]|nr:GNAT family N-acetyltransferase [Mucilaginibacter polytrichastri]
MKTALTFTSPKIRGEISIRTEMRPGDLGMITWMHGKYYAEENGYSIDFERYVAEGLAEFYREYDPLSNRLWICEHDGEMIGSICLMKRGSDAQLRYFFIRKPFRGTGLGTCLMQLWFEFYRSCGFSAAYLWTVKGLPEATALYTRFGFTPADEKPSTAFGPVLTEQKFVLKRS